MRKLEIIRDEEFYTTIISGCLPVIHETTFGYLEDNKINEIIWNTLDNYALTEIEFYEADVDGCKHKLTIPDYFNDILIKNRTAEDIFNLNMMELTDNYFLNSLPEKLLIDACFEAAEKGLYLYVYTTAVNKGPALETSIKVVYTTETTKYRHCLKRIENAEDGKFSYEFRYKDGGYVELGRARLCKTPRGALYRFVEDLIETLESY